MIWLLDEDPPVAAARIALLAVRARLADTETPLNRFRLPDGGRVLEVESAAIALARIEGPLVLRASVEDGVIHVARSLEEWMMRIPREPPLFRKEARRHGAAYDALPVCCIGAGEALLVTAGALEAWRRGYVIAMQGGHNASPPSHYLGQHPRVARQAYEAGAVGIVLFHFPRAPWPADTGDVIVLHRARRWNHPRVLEHGPGSAPCALCGAHTAGWRETVTWTRPWRERRLCSRCVGARIGARAVQRVRRLDEAYATLTPLQLRERHDDIIAEVERLARPFRHLPVPPEVAAFIDRWRAP
jgi:hypothetical protein